MRLKVLCLFALLFIACEKKDYCAYSSCDVSDMDVLDQSKGLLCSDDSQCPSLINAESRCDGGVCLFSCRDGFGVFEGDDIGVKGCGCDVSIASCRLEPLCGDGFVEGGEECDVKMSSTCEYGESECEVCNLSCKVSSGDVVGFCGDGLIQRTFGETCDGSTSKVCSDVDHFLGEVKCSEVACVEDYSGCFSVGSVSLGAGHSCAVLNDRRVKCWGYNSNGQSGQVVDVKERVLSPSYVLGLEGVESISMGGYHSCAVVDSGDVKCWGLNRVGQLGDGSILDRFEPESVYDLKSVSSVSVGLFHSCAVVGGGGVKCWGQNDHGQLGILGGDRFTPLDVDGITDVKYVKLGGYHTCAVNDNGVDFRCWGRNGDGQLGVGNVADSSVPIKVSTGGNVRDFDLGGRHTCVITSLGVKCWGKNNAGQLGVGNNVNSNLPISVEGVDSAVELALGDSHSCARLFDGKVKCWGENAFGQLGDGSIKSSNVPVDVLGVSDVVEIDAGSGYTCARSKNGAVKCWGDNRDGSLGDGQASDVAQPTPIDVKWY